MLRKLARLADAFPLVGLRLRDWRDRRDRRAIAWTAVPGYDFEVLGGNWLAAGAHEGVELAIVDRLLGEADVLIDVGANSGIFSCLGARRGKAVWALEAMPATVAILMQVLQRNRLSEAVEVYPLAASDGVGVLPFYGRGQGASLVRGWAGQAEFDRIDVAVNTLDNLFAGRLAGRRAVAKIDVEGAELAVLTGAAAVLARCTGLLIEISLTRNQPTGLNPDFAAIFALLAAAGFAAFVADVGEQAVTPEMVAGWVARGRSDLGTENFFFVRTDRALMVGG